MRRNTATIFALIFCMIFTSFAGELPAKAIESSLAYTSADEYIMEEYTITDSQGIHARPAGLLVKEASKFSSDIKVLFNEKSGDAKRLFSIMGLGIKCGNKITVTIDGADEEIAVSAMKDFLEKNL